MGVVKRQARPTFYPGHTVWGEVGECVYIGDHVLGNEKQPGCSVYLSARELNEACQAMWGESYEQLRARVNEIGVANAALLGRVDELNEALEEAARRVTAGDLVARALAEIRAEEANEKEIA